MGNTPSFRQEFGIILIGAIVFTASFLWRDFFSDIREAYFPAQNDLIGRFIFTLLITAGLIYFAIHLRGLFGLNTPQAQQAPQPDEGDLNADNNDNDQDVVSNITSLVSGIDPGPRGVNLPDTNSDN